MTITEMTTALNANSETGFYGNYDSAFQITDEQAGRISAASESAAYFIDIWENADWWL
jgi:hypothetical protein